MKGISARLADIAGVALFTATWTISAAAISGQASTR